MPIPFVERPNSHVVDASPDGDRALTHRISDYCIDRFVVHQDPAADALVEPDVDFVLVDVVNELVVALTFVEFVDLEHKIINVH